MEIASIHGRFQPFHNGHLGYALAAFERAEFVFVGLTQLYRGSEVVRPRDADSANPLGFFRRRELVLGALVEAGVPRDRFDIIPFPIEQPEELQRFLPLSIPCLTTVVDEWNNEKIELLSSLGYTTHVLPTLHRDEVTVASGTRIRQLIRAGDMKWQSLVPPYVARQLKATEF